MIIGLLKELVGWFVSLTEAAASIAAILLIGLVAGTTGFWILSHCLRKLSGPPAEEDEDSLPSEPEVCERVPKLPPH
jgi:hypothetical protein